MGRTKIWAIFKRLLKKESWRWKYVLGSAFKWKRLHIHHFSFIDDLLFKIASIFEAIFLVSTLCFFYLCCGCQI
ncbi:hypothetical protein ERO13_D06G205000v2 [Gossypium hirsutum]|uniref:Uncharacterized protein n=3 Tax=Gossypium TaxID=3633 RepID=A0A5J5R5G0_GOSBA|nr:hypothetical protein ES319_D06G240200v1 [Gossypium barbadense]KAG4143661.1 hypothetical protein ERO13_D06G205000v2 [Gossypium hirsutum]TYG66253.1 hypothetical protein ES288_D06G253000v1 [Gossypium darwinii]TYH68415.1 hypothetical protein ES332_D06G257600v1 [Gossypium tomentosum]